MPKQVEISFSSIDGKDYGPIAYENMDPDDLEELGLDEELEALEEEYLGEVKKVQLAIKDKLKAVFAAKGLKAKVYVPDDSSDLWYS